jgi:ATP-dependent protease ClpP protease subunit
MPKEILLYSTIYSYTATDFINQLEAAKGQDVVIRVNTNGGNPEDAFGMIAKLSERTKNTAIKVDGKAHSMGAFLLAYADSAEALDVSQFLIHRAAYPSWIESNKEYMTQQMWDSLNLVNGKLRAAFESKVNVKAFEALKGVTLDQIFSNDGRKEIMLTAPEAMSIGLIDKISAITPDKKAEINSLCSSIGMAALYEEAEATITSTQPNKDKMAEIKTLDDLKAQHPDIFKAAKEEGVTEERSRIQAWQAWKEIDAEAVEKGIKEGKVISPTDISEFSAKAVSPDRLKKIAGDNPKDIPTGEDPDKPGEPTAESKEFWNAVAEKTNTKSLKIA